MQYREDLVEKIPVYGDAEKDSDRTNAECIDHSDRTAFGKVGELYFVKISDWIGYINYCKEKCNV